MATEDPSRCPHCGGDIADHCEDDDCRMVQCVDCKRFGMPGGRSWLEPRKWDKPA